MKRRVLGMLAMVLPLLVLMPAAASPTPALPAPNPIHFDLDGAPASNGGGVEHWPGAISPGVRRSSSDATLVSTPQRPRYVVVMVLDGARPGYLDVSGIPHVRALMKRGTVYTNALAGVLESETPTGHAAIGSGMLPKSNQILGFGWEGQESKWVSVFDPSLINQHVMEGLMSHAPSLAQRLHGKSPNIQVAAVGSYKYYANDALGGPDADYTLYYAPTSEGKFAPTAVPGHVPPQELLTTPELIAPTHTGLPLGESDHLAMLLAADTFKDTGANVIMLNIPQFDQPLGHVYGANRDPAMVETLMRDFDRDLGMLENVYRKAGVLDQTMFVITADHGFQAFDHIVTPDEINKDVAKTGVKVTHASYESSDYLWINDPARAKRAATGVTTAGNPNVEAVYYKEVYRGAVRYVRASSSHLFHAPGMEAANQLLLQSFAGATSPDVVVMFRQGVDGVDPSSKWKGDHGGADWESQHIPLVMAGPGIRAGRVSSYPARLIDIAPTILSLFGGSYTGMDGTPLADALTKPPAGTTEAQSQRSGSLLPAVTALSAESRADRSAVQGR